MNTLQRSRAPATASASYRGRYSIEAPLPSTQFTATNSPWAWNMGSACRRTSRGEKSHASTRATAFVARLPWLSIAPFGRPVVPLVYKMAAGSPGPQSASGAPDAAPALTLESSDSSASTASVTTSAGARSSTRKLISLGVATGLNGENTIPDRRQAR